MKEKLDDLQKDKTNTLSKSLFYIEPSNEEKIEDALNDCYQQLVNNLNKKGLNIGCVLKQTIFINAINNKDYIIAKKTISECINQPYSNIPTSIVAQAPESGKSLAFEFLYTPAHKVALDYKTIDDIKYIVKFEEGIKEIITAGLSSGDLNASIYQQSIDVFKKMEKILTVEKISFANIIRQWNYIEGITMCDNGTSGNSQHYQLFNDVRTAFYEKSIFNHGYPSATGIGADAGGIIVDFIAATDYPKGSMTVIPIKSPVQIDAYNYTGEVLAENFVDEKFNKTTPKFERAKMLLTGSSGVIYISGTAAIIGQQTIPSPDARTQTEITLENIQKLIEAENLQAKHFKGIKPSVHLEGLRVYVKDFSMFKQVKEVCCNYFPDTPIILIKSDICRNELLIEIEGIASVFV